jgi:hypothetical protein
MLLQDIFLSPVVTYLNGIPIQLLLGLPRNGTSRMIFQWEKTAQRSNEESNWKTSWFKKAIKT